MAGGAFRFPYDIQSTLEPWRHELGSSFDDVVAHLSDRDRALEDYLSLWMPYVPTWGSSGTQPVIGNGILSGRYVKLGTTVMGTITMTPRSTSTFGTGNYFWTPPVPVSPQQAPFATVGVFKGYNAGASLNAIFRFNGSGNFQAMYSATWPAGLETAVGQTTPWTWANGNSLDMNFAYEAAS